MPPSIQINQPSSTGIRTDRYHDSVSASNSKGDSTVIDHHHNQQNKYQTSSKKNSGRTTTTQESYKRPATKNVSFEKSRSTAVVADGAKNNSSNKQQQDNSKNDEQEQVTNNNINTSQLSPYDNNGSVYGTGMTGMGGMYGLGSMGGYGMGGYGMGGYGMGGYGGMGMPMMGGMSGLGGPLNNLNQFLFGVQTLIFSLGQAVQVIGMNTQAMHQLFDSASSMIDHAIVTYNEMRTLNLDEDEANQSEEQKKRIRRLRALRYTMVVGATYVAYRLFRRIIQTILSSRRKNRHSTRRILPSGTTTGLGPQPVRQYQQYDAYNNNSYGSGYPGYQSSPVSSYYGAGPSMYNNNSYYGGQGSGYGYGSGFY